MSHPLISACPAEPDRLTFRLRPEGEIDSFQLGRSGLLSVRGEASLFRPV